jgi:hypothetical protein
MLPTLLGHYLESKFQDVLGQSCLRSGRDSQGPPGCEVAQPVGPALRLLYLQQTEGTLEFRYREMGLHSAVPPCGISRHDSKPGWHEPWRLGLGVGWEWRISVPEPAGTGPGAYREGAHEAQITLPRKQEMSQTISGGNA